ncbi:hypothetical protein [Citrobacter freundii]|uniref:hypothetical protein n=1 Tax=Citrobacter freundii TaxID=546 RepID=UPI0023B1E1C1|nr:hypothetical protein [Citrobacter freundii]
MKTVHHEEAPARGPFLLPHSGEKLIKQGFRCEKTLCNLHPVLCTIYSLVFVRFEPLNLRKYAIRRKPVASADRVVPITYIMLNMVGFLTNYGAARMRGLFHIQGSLTDGS